MGFACSRGTGSVVPRRRRAVRPVSPRPARPQGMAAALVPPTDKRRLSTSKASRLLAPVASSPRGVPLCAPRAMGGDHTLRRSDPVRPPLRSDIPPVIPPSMIGRVLFASPRASSPRNGRAPASPATIPRDRERKKAARPRPAREGPPKVPPRTRGVPSPAPIRSVRVNIKGAFRRLSVGGTLEFPSRPRGPPRASAAERWWTSGSPASRRPSVLSRRRDSAVPARAHVLRGQRHRPPARAALRFGERTLPGVGRKPGEVVQVAAIAARQGLPPVGVPDGPSVLDLAGSAAVAGLPHAAHLPGPFGPGSLTLGPRMRPAPAPRIARTTQSGKNLGVGKVA